MISFVCSPVSGSNGPTSFELFPDPPLHCGDPVNETVYDYLEGIANRKFHPPFPEPEVAMIFKKSELEEVDLALIENNLMRTISEVRFRILLHHCMKGSLEIALRL